ncbi:MAG: hypothetical protein H0W09_01865 [Solirubrobacterales bacterium]|nr:hypothetical protein [Solirubrobacterales bacterium]
MPLRKRTPEEIAAKEADKQRQAADKDLRRRQQSFDQAWQEFRSSPAGQARQAFDSGDHVFQYSIDVMNQQAIIVAMIGSTTTNRAADPTAVLNSVCREGWELVNGDFVFVMTGQQSRDKFMSSGQNVAVAGTVIAYYLFRRCEENHEAESDAALRLRLGDPAQA